MGNEMQVQRDIPTARLHDSGGSIPCFVLALGKVFPGVLYSSQTP